ncbi:TniQ family protein [Streptomyces sp. LUP47B]|uniref:TniQ family protein n=1 Tax=Streptomyces sp. LUP47B TaxID=1890286 RepID=UPI00099F995F
MVTPPTRYELPRGLVPLPGESLPGLLLRLSYRLRRTPYRIAALCGLQKGYRIPATHLLKLPHELTIRVSGCLRLTAQETESLTLSSLTDAYLPLASMPPETRLSGPTLGANWAFNLSTRFCPQCLDGDGSPIQNAFGGPWILRWHLPTNVVCPVHHRLLASKCPTCRQPINGVVDARIGLICSPGVPELNPQQCRNLLPPNVPMFPGGKAHIKPCGALLSQLPITTDGAISSEDINLLIALQQQMDRKLGGSVFEKQDGEYLQDLILSTLLIKFSWPLGSSLLSSTALKDSLDAYAAPISAQAAAQRSTSNFTGRLVGPRNLPQEAAPCGALLMAAEALLGDRDAASLQERVQPIARMAHERAPQYLLNIMNSMGISPAMARAVSRRVHGFPAGPLPRALTPQGSFQLQNVPPFLPKPWFDAHFSDFMDKMHRTTPRTTRQLRRGAALRLAEIASGQPWYRCTEALGIPNKAARGTVNYLGEQLGPPNLWPAFEAKVLAISHQLGRDKNPINYSIRRHALTNWRMPLDDWMTLCDLPFLSRLRNKEYPTPGSVFVWSEATSSEHLHSPLIQALKRIGEPSAPLTSEAGRFYEDHRPTGSWPRLRQRLESYAATIARACDLGNSLHVDLGDLLSPDQETSRNNRDAEVGLTPM